MTPRRPASGPGRRRGAGPSGPGKPGKRSAPREPTPEGARLQKVIADAGVASRRAAEALITAGRVKVDGRVVTALGTRVDPEHATIEVDGRAVRPQAKIVVVMNKPDEMVCSAEPDTDPRGRPTVVSLLGRLGARLFPIGRLDYHTRGVLLLTNDGELASALAHPRRGVPKTYHAKFQGRLGEDQLAQLHAGVQLEDGTRTRPALEVEIVKATTTNTWVQITISQGLNRQIRRMGEAIGHSVLKLIRVAYAGITADGLREGQWRVLKPEEITTLRAACGLTRKGRLAQADRAAAAALLAPRSGAPRRTAPSGGQPAPRPAAAKASSKPAAAGRAAPRPASATPASPRSASARSASARPASARPAASQRAAPKPAARRPAAPKGAASEPAPKATGPTRTGPTSAAAGRGAAGGKAGPAGARPAKPGGRRGGGAARLASRRGRG